jgi:tetratricopeptide (TPR) repeat protein
MSVNVSKLRKQAAELEQKRQLDKALEKYIQILDALGDHVDEVDIALYNRVGDLLMRQSSVADAVGYYERAVDLYTDGGFFNNAIALCNKILRNAPGRTSVYYKLGRISAKKGFIADAKQNFLEYADRMQRAGQMEEAFRALTELADLCPDQEDIRLMLADQLAKTDRKSEAIEQLQTLYDKLQAEGRAREARATADRMRAIDPEVAPRAATVTPTKKRGDLVFLEVNYDAAPPAPRLRDAARPAAPASEESGRDVPGSRAGDLPLIHPDLDDLPSPPEPPIADTLQVPSASVGASQVPSLDIGEVQGLEPPFEVEDSPIVDGLERTAVEADDSIEFVPVAGLEHSGMDSGAMHSEGSALETGAIDIDSVEGSVKPVEVEAESPVDGEPALPMLDVGELPSVSPKAPDLGLLHPDDGLLMPEVGCEVEESGTGIDAGGRDGHIPALSLEFQNDQSALLEHNRGDAEAEFAAAEEEVGAEPLGEPPAAPREPVKSLIEIDIVEDIVPPAAPPPPAPRSCTPAFDPELEGLDFIVEAPGPRNSEEVAAPESAASADADSSAEEDESLAPLPLIEPPVEEPPLAFEPPRAWSPETKTAPAGAKASGHAAPSPVEELSTLDRLRRSAAEAPESGHQRQLLGEALLEDGDRVGGMRALEDAMKLYERQEDFSGARSVVEGLLHLDPNSIRHHQKRVEYAFRSSDRGRLVDAYLGLADCLFRAGQVEKCRAVYIRVSELAPEDRRAREALRSIDPDDSLTPAEGNEIIVGNVVPEPAPSTNGSHGSGEPDSFVNLSSWLTDDAAPKSTRMVADVDLPENDAQVDFRKMLDMFKQGVAANVEDTDHESHYDLGVAYKEMGLLDEAIAEFQKALRGTENRVRTYEALGQCFVEKRQFQIAVTILSRALTDRRYTDEMLIGVLYLLGTAHQALAQLEEARTFYERVVAVDIGFGQAHDRLSTLGRAR